MALKRSETYTSAEISAALRYRIVVSGGGSCVLVTRNEFASREKAEEFLAAQDSLLESYRN